MQTKKSAPPRAARSRGDLPDVLVRKRWDRLTEADREEAAGDPKLLARKIAERYHISLRKAKRQVHDAATVARVVRVRGTSRGKRIRRALERPAAVIFEETAELVRIPFRTLRHEFTKLVAFASGLPGQSPLYPPPSRPLPDDLPARSSGLGGESGLRPPPPPPSALEEP